jgi:hypothetical protein
VAGWGAKAITPWNKHNTARTLVTIEDESMIPLVVGWGKLLIVQNGNRALLSIIGQEND